MYDPVLGTVPLQVSVRSDGYAYSESTFLGENGVVLGYYRVYNGMTYAGERVLYWSPDEGLHDLGQLVDGGLDENGWAALGRAIQVNGLGQILGYGVAEGLSGPSRSAYLLTPVPEQLIPGDYNQNGTVDAADYTVWRDNLDSGTALPNDDTAGVGQDDYTRWKNNFGQSAGSGAAANAVPEPASCMLLLVAIIALVARPRCNA